MKKNRTNKMFRIIGIRKKKIMNLLLLFCVVLILYIAIGFTIASAQAKARFQIYEAKSESIETSFGTIQYIDEGKGETILSCHGICGGYDQAYDTLSDQLDTYRVIAPSRFGYPGSDVPSDPSIENQATAFVELLDQLHIEKTYVLGTSAGGAVAIKFALMYPERTKGLILFCSGYPATAKPEKVSTYMGPPPILCHDFPMWFFRPLFGPLMGMNSDTIKQIMPLSERYDGILLDAAIANTVLDSEYQNYDLSNLQVPALILHAKDDKLADYKRAEIWSQKIPDCTFVSFEHGGHLMVGNSNTIQKSMKEFVY